MGDQPKGFIVHQNRHDGQTERYQTCKNYRHFAPPPMRATLNHRYRISSPSGLRVDRGRERGAGIWVPCRNFLDRGPCLTEQVDAAACQPINAPATALFGNAAAHSFFNDEGAENCTPGSSAGGMAERFKAPVLKTGVGATSPWVKIPLPPPLAPAKAFSRCGRGWIFPLFSRVMREKLFTSVCVRRPDGILLGPVFSGPVHHADLVNSTPTS